MKKLLVILGPTGTGKTKLALHLAKQYPSILISADSRQVYRGMDIVTGKDHPQDADIHGIDIVNPDQACSVSVWYDSVLPALHAPALPIVVGGTGFYVKAVTEGIPTMHVLLNQQLRDQLNPLSVSELQSRLETLDSAKYASMNNSDQHNPRRLIRAIEVALSPQKVTPTTSNRQSLLIGLEQSDSSHYRDLVRARVVSRLKLGAVEETKKLLEKYEMNSPSLTAIGYRSIIQFLQGELTEAQMLEKWDSDELAYAKRQMTWFRKVPAIHWFDIADTSLTEKIAKLVAKWYAER